jgi:hypothetical protein
MGSPLAFSLVPLVPLGFHLDDLQGLVFVSRNLIESYGDVLR